MGIVIMEILNTGNNKVILSRSDAVYNSNCTTVNSKSF